MELFCNIQQARHLFWTAAELHAQWSGTLVNYRWQDTNNQSANIIIIIIIIIILFRPAA